MSISGQSELMARLQEAGSEARTRVSAIVRETAFDVQADAVESIQRGDKTGIVYTKSNPTRTHQASAPGEAPASDTGILAGSIDTQKVADLTYEVGTNLHYGALLEFGTLKIAERPWLRPAVDRNREEFFTRLRAALS